MTQNRLERAEARQGAGYRPLSMQEQAKALEVVRAVIKHFNLGSRCGACYSGPPNHFEGCPIAWWQEEAK